MRSLGFQELKSVWECKQEEEHKTIKPEQLKLHSSDSIELEQDLQNLQLIDARPNTIRFMSLWNEYLLKNNHRALQVLASLESSAETIIMGFLANYGSQIVQEKQLFRACQVHFLILFRSYALSLKSFINCLKQLRGLCNQKN